MIDWDAVRAVVPEGTVFVRIRDLRSKVHTGRLVRYGKGDSKYRKNRRAHLRVRFGLTLEQYKEMEKEQGGLCLICRGTNGDRDLAVDHCHATGRIRGLLCSSCNLGLGAFKDRIESLKEAALYLGRFQ